METKRFQGYDDSLMRVRALPLLACYARVHHLSRVSRQALVIVVSNFRLGCRFVFPSSDSGLCRLLTRIGRIKIMNTETSWYGLHRKFVHTVHDDCLHQQLRTAKGCFDRLDCRKYMDRTDNIQDAQVFSRRRWERKRICKLCGDR